MVKSLRSGLILLSCLAWLTACGGESRMNDPSGTSADYAREGQDSTLGLNGNLSGGGDLFQFGTSKQRRADAAAAGGIGVNAYLWRGALDTLSFMPLASADPFGGVIVTDWYAPPASSGERFKAAAYILGRELRSDAVRVVIYRQVLQGGQWVDTTVSAATIGEIENKVLARARQLRVQSQASS